MSAVKSFVCAVLLFCVQVAYGAVFGSLEPQNVAYYVQDLETGKVLAQHRADAPMHPASTMKLVTAFVAFAELGTDYRWTTRLTSRAPVHNGILDGNLFWKGSGDPVLDQKDIVAMQRQLQDNGVFRISGSVVLDRSVWDSVGTAEGFLHDAEEVFAVAPDPHMLAYKVAWLDTFKNADGVMSVSLNPPLDEAYIRNRLRPGRAAHCRTPAAFIRADWDGSALNLSGTLPESCDGKQMFINMMDAREFAVASFNSQWRNLGGSGPVSFRDGTEPAGNRVLAEHRSPPLAEVVRDMNKFSNNLIARTVFLTLGRNSGKHKPVIPGARETVYKHFIRHGISTHTLALENGSGLSRDERISARVLGQVLYEAYHSPFRQPFIESLPLAGVDGTLKKRLGDVPQLYMKTGTLRDVRALAGYKLPQTPDEHPLAVVVIASGSSSLPVADLDNLTRSLIPGATLKPAAQPAAGKKAGRKKKSSQISAKKRKRK